jgi:hypothetical protein
VCSGINRSDYLTVIMSLKHEPVIVIKTLEDSNDETIYEDKIPYLMSLKE